MTPDSCSDGPTGRLTGCPNGRPGDGGRVNGTGETRLGEKPGSYGLAIHRKILLGKYITGLPIESENGWPVSTRCVDELGWRLRRYTSDVVVGC